MYVCVHTHIYSALTEKHILYKNVYFFLKKKQKNPSKQAMEKHDTLILVGNK